MDGTSLKKTFVAAGQAPKEDGTFVTYKTHARSSVAASLLPEGKAHETATLATVAGEMDVVTYDEDEEPKTDEEDDAQDDE